MPTSCITGIGGYSEEARCHGVGRFSESEHHCKSGWREGKRGKGSGGELTEREVAGHEDAWMRREAGEEMRKARMQ